tara:strand:- start:5 stop:487 length:483 start_codon:yes stop_codon:yes gene_type:complete
MTKTIGLVILVIVFLLIVISLILTLTDSPSEIKKGSPENIVQIYIESILKEDFESSYSLLSNETKVECDFSDYIINIEREIELFNRGTVEHDKTITVKENQEVIVYIDISVVTSTVPFGTNDYTNDEKITLIKSEYPQEDSWKISKTSFVNSCNINPKLK